MVNKNKFKIKDVENVIYQTKSAPSSIDEFSKKIAEGSITSTMFDEIQIDILKALKEKFGDKPFYIKQAAQAFDEKGLERSLYTTSKYLAILEAKGFIERSLSGGPYKYYHFTSKGKNLIS